jgi:hypothetical protein
MKTTITSRDQGDGALYSADVPRRPHTAPAGLERP